MTNLSPLFLRSVGAGLTKYLLPPSPSPCMVGKTRPEFPSRRLLIKTRNMRLSPGIVSQPASKFNTHLHTRTPAHPLTGTSFALLPQP
ncbi:hypothetical protein [Microseira sp. BLCC-F43]|jgi:hypothetical protein|uniref:hypothetical protein n=1 Tax=Microseira sp. BLCC-F43 TaxID=3153602 RepID=UPI0035BAB0A9